MRSTSARCPSRTGEQLLPFVPPPGSTRCREDAAQIAPLIQERIKLLRDVATAADFFFVDELPPYDPAELIPQKGDRGHGARRWSAVAKFLRRPSSRTTRLDAALRAGRGETENQGRPDVPAHPRRGVRAQSRAAAV